MFHVNGSKTDIKSVRMFWKHWNAVSAVSGDGISVMLIPFFPSSLCTGLAATQAKHYPRREAINDFLSAK